MNRLKRFYHRFKNQYHTHHHWASLCEIIEMSWSQSKNTKPPEFNPTKIDIKDLTKNL